MPDRWELTIIFDDLETQAKVDDELRFPHDEASRVVAFISSRWDILPEDLEETVHWSDKMLMVECDILDPLVRVIEHTLTHTVPRRVFLRRNDERV